MYGLDEERKTSTAYMTQIQHNGKVLNECLQPQKYYIRLDIKDPDGKMVCQLAMSHDQFIRLMMTNCEVPVTLDKYRGLDGKLITEEVPKPDSVQDRYVKRIDKVGESLKNRIVDLKKDIYEAMNSEKSIGKKKLEEMYHDLKVIENHYESNLSYMVECGAEEIAEIQENAKSQLTIFASQHFGADLKSTDFSLLIEGKSHLALPGVSEPGIVDNYIPKERELKPVDEMTAMEVADAINDKLKKWWYIEDDYLNGKTREERENASLYYPSTSYTKDHIFIGYVNYHGKSKVELDVAKRYLKYLIDLKDLRDFKYHYNF